MRTSNFTTRMTKQAAIEKLEELAADRKLSAKRLGDQRRSPKAAYEAGMALAYTVAAEIVADIVTLDEYLPEKGR
jgi:hypothetical protein